MKQNHFINYSVFKKGLQNVRALTPHQGHEQCEVKNREKLEIAHTMLVLEQNIPNQKFSNTFSGVQLKTKYFTIFSGV
jgi:nicotinate-nucleotide pyrophosphorylase